MQGHLLMVHLSQHALQVQKLEGVILLHQVIPLRHPKAYPRNALPQRRTLDMEARIFWMSMLLTGF